MRIVVIKAPVTIAEAITVLTNLAVMKAFTIPALKVIAIQNPVA
jgi:hypothetical protein